MLDLGSRKGQYFSFDAIVASVIFVLTLIMLLSYWQSVRTYLDYQSNDLNKEAVRISTLLFSPPTYSSSTRDCGTMTNLGLALNITDKRIDENILTCQFDEATLKAKLGTNFNVSIGIADAYVDAEKYAYTLGPSPDSLPSDLKEVSRLRRTGTLSISGENHLAIVDIYVYR